MRLTGVLRLAVPLSCLCLLVGCADTDRVQEAAPGPGAVTTAAPVEAPTPARTGPLGDGGRAASCVEMYSPQTIGRRAFAFDGTVTALGPGSTDRPDKGSLDTVAVTFRVHEWFSGGAEPTVTVDLVAPGVVAGDEPPAYEQGARLLVSGEPRWGGAPLDAAIAWTCGGFTRYYEPDVVDDWRTGTA